MSSAHTSQIDVGRYVQPKESECKAQGTIFKVCLTNTGFKHVEQCQALNGDVCETANLHMDRETDANRSESAVDKNVETCIFETFC